MSWTYLQHWIVTNNLIWWYTWDDVLVNRVRSNRFFIHSVIFTIKRWLIWWLSIWEITSLSTPFWYFSFHVSGFSFPRDFGSCSRPGIVGTASTGLKSQLSFSRRGIPDTGDSAGCSYNSDVTSGSVSQSYMSSNFSISSCGDTNSIIFSAPSSKRVKDNNEEIITISNIEPQVVILFISYTLKWVRDNKYLFC